VSRVANWVGKIGGSGGAEGTFCRSRGANRRPSVPPVIQGPRALRIKPPIWRSGDLCRLLSRPALAAGLEYPGRSVLRRGGLCSPRAAVAPRLPSGGSQLARCFSATWDVAVDKCDGPRARGLSTVDFLRGSGSVITRNHFPTGSLELPSQSRLHKARRAAGCAARVPSDGGGSRPEGARACGSARRQDITLGRQNL